jgi:hypothetical protein
MNCFRRMRWARHVAILVWIRNSHKILIEKLEETRPFEKLRLGCDDNITIDLQDVWCEDVDWIHLSQDKNQWRALVHTVIKLRAP